MKTKRQATNPSSECDSLEKREERAEMKIWILLFYCVYLPHNNYVKCTFNQFFQQTCTLPQTSVNLSAFFALNK